MKEGCLLSKQKIQVRILFIVAVMFRKLEAIGSIFKEKQVFEKGHYRTTTLAYGFISENHNETIFK